MTASLPLILVAAVLIVVCMARLLQFIQSSIFHVLPFGATSDTTLTDVCIGILITGNYYLYFRKSIRFLGEHHYRWRIPQL